MKSKSKNLKKKGSDNILLSRTFLFSLTLFVISNFYNLRSKLNHWIYGNQTFR